MRVLVAEELLAPWGHQGRCSWRLAYHFRSRTWFSSAPESVAVSNLLCAAKTPAGMTTYPVLARNSTDRTTERVRSCFASANFVYSFDSLRKQGDKQKEFNIPSVWRTSLMSKDWM